MKTKRKRVSAKAWALVNHDGEVMGTDESRSYLRVCLPYSDLIAVRVRITEIVPKKRKVQP